MDILPTLNGISVATVIEELLESRLTKLILRQEEEHRGSFLMPLPSVSVNSIPAMVLLFDSGHDGLPKATAIGMRPMAGMNTG